MNKEMLVDYVSGILKSHNKELSHLDKIDYCLFNANHLHNLMSNRFANVNSIIELRALGVTTENFDEYIEYCLTAHKANSGMRYCAIGVIGNACFYLHFGFRISSRGTLMKNKAISIMPLEKFSPDWLSKLSTNKKPHKISDVAKKLKLEQFLDDEENENN